MDQRRFIIRYGLERNHAHSAINDYNDSRLNLDIVFELRPAETNSRKSKTRMIAWNYEHSFLR